MPRRRRRLRSTSTCAYLFTASMMEKTSNRRHRSETISLRLTAARNVERDGDALAFAKGPRAVPHPRGEEGQAAGLGFDHASRRKIEAELGLRLAERQPARSIVAAQVGRQHD